MELSNNLVSKFVKATTDTSRNKGETTVYGTAKVNDGRTYVKLDGSDLLTPAANLTNITDGDRVTVMIKDHTATITGNIDSPSATSGEVINMGNTVRDEIVGEVDKIVSDEVKTIVEENIDGITARVEKTETKIENIKIGARNLIRNSTNLIFGDYYFISNNPETALLGSAILGTMILDKEG